MRAVSFKSLICLGLPVLAVMFAGFTDPAAAQAVSVDFGGESGLTERVVQLVALLTILSLAPSILMMVTSFTRIVIVLSLLRTAIGTGQSPPNSVLISLALFLTAFIMAPVATEAYQNGVAPLMAQEIDVDVAFEQTSAPFKTFMLNNTRDKDLELFLDLAGSDDMPATLEDTPLMTVIPAFMISEIRRAFEIGFLLFVPFLVIDMVVASVLMAMGMMMLPPIIISMPFKLIFFVLVDGWFLVTGSLVQSYGVG